MKCVSDQLIKTGLLLSFLLYCLSDSITNRALNNSYPVLSDSDLHDLELLPAGAERHLAVDLVVDPLGVRHRASFLPIWPQGRHELAPVDRAVAFVEPVRVLNRDKNRCQGKLKLEWSGTLLSLNSTFS